MLVSELGDLSVQFDLVINATSASLRGELPPVHTGVFAPGCLAYELAYGKGLTPFLKLAQGRAPGGWPTASACSSSRRRKLSNGGAACAPKRQQ